MDRMAGSEARSDSFQSVTKRNDGIKVKSRSDDISDVLGRFGAACNLLYRW